MNWEKMDICLEQPNDYGFDSTEDSTDENFVGLVFNTLIISFNCCYWKLNTHCTVSALLEVFIFFLELIEILISAISVWSGNLKDQVDQKTWGSYILV